MIFVKFDIVDLSHLLVIISKIDYLYLSVNYFVEQQPTLIKRKYFSLNIQTIITKCRLSEGDSVAPFM